LAVERDGGKLGSAQFSHCRKPVAAIRQLRANLVLGQMGWPAYHRRHANSAFEEAEFCAAVDARASASQERALFGRIALVGLDDYDRALPQPECVELSQQSAHTL